MTSYLIDTNICVEYLRRSNQRVLAKFAVTDVTQIYLCDTILAELFFGAYKSQRVAHNLRLVRVFASPYVVLSSARRVARTYGKIRAELQNRGQMVGSNDLFIASTAVAYRLTLVTHNVSEFSRVPDLFIEDWAV